MNDVVAPWISLRNGGHLDLLDPKRDQIRVDDIAAALSKLCRYTGHCSHFYSVAEHCVRASFLVAPPLALRALLHDASEAYLNDISTPLKRLLPDYMAIEARVEACIDAAFGFEGPLPPEVKVADRVMLATEKRDLMPGTPDWPILDGIAPLPGIIHPWQWYNAEFNFMNRFNQLRDTQ